MIRARVGTMNRGFFATLLLLLPPFAFAVEHPSGSWTETEGLIRSPYPPHRTLDVKGYKAGTLVKDPTSEEIFKIPEIASGEISNKAKVGTPKAPSTAPRNQDLGTRLKTPDPNTTPLRDSPSARPTNRTTLSNVPSQELGDFIVSYIQSGEAEDPAVALPFFARRVDFYFGEKNVSRDEILRDRRAFVKKWPVRDYEIIHNPVVLDHIDDIYRLMVRLRYYVSAGETPATGSVTDFISVRETPRGFEIIGVEEVRALPGGDDGATEAPQVVPDSDIQPVLPEISRFITAFIASGESGDAAASLKFYDSKVSNYYGQRNPSRQELIQERGSYLRKWPSRHYWLEDRPRIKTLGSGRYQASYGIGYIVSNGARKLTGSNMVQVDLLETADGLKVTSIDEK